MGFTQKQAVAVLYLISAILGLSRWCSPPTNAMKAMLFLLALCMAGAFGAGSTCPTATAAAPAPRGG